MSCALPGRGDPPPVVSRDPPSFVPPGWGKGGRTGGSERRRGAGPGSGPPVAQSSSFSAPSPPPDPFPPTELRGGRSLSRPPAWVRFLPPVLPPFLSFFIFFPFPFFVNENGRSRAVPGTAALGVFAAAPSELAGRVAAAASPLSSPTARRLQPPQPEDPRRRRGPAAGGRRPRAAHSSVPP